MGVEHQLNDVMICPRAHRLKAVIYISEWASATSAPRSAIPPGPRLLAQKLHYCTLPIGTKKDLKLWNFYIWLLVLGEEQVEIEILVDVFGTT